MRRHGRPDLTRRRLARPPAPGVAAMLAALMIANTVLPATGAFARAAELFPDVALPAVSSRPYRTAYACMAGGLVLGVASFVLEQRADDRYASYQSAVDPDEIVRLYDETRRYDQWSTAALLGGEALIGLGVYLRFLHRPAEQRVRVLGSMQRCGLSLSF